MIKIFGFKTDKETGISQDMHIKGHLVLVIFLRESCGRSLNESVSVYETTSVYSENYTKCTNTYILQNKCITV